MHFNTSFHLLAMLLSGVFLFQSCNSCDCTGKQNKIHFNTEEKQLIPEHSGPTSLIFNNQQGITDTIYYDSNRFYIESDCASVVIPIPSSCCVCPTDHNLYQTSSYMEQKTNHLNQGFFKINLSKDKSEFALNINFHGVSKSLEDATPVDTLQIDNRTFLNVLKWHSSYESDESSDHFRTVYFSKTAGILKLIKSDSSEWVRAF